MTENILTRNNVQVSGRGSQPLMFAHGFGCDQNMWRFIAPEFEADYKIILFDYVGSGKSDIGAYDAKRYGDLNGYARDVIEICDALDLKDVMLCRAFGQQYDRCFGFDRKTGAFQKSFTGRAFAVLYQRSARLCRRF